MNTVLSFIFNYPYLLSLVLFIVCIVIAKPTKRKKLLSIALLAFPFSFVIVKIFAILFQDPTKFVEAYLLPLFSYTVETIFWENQILICLTVAAVVFAEYKRVGILFTLLAILLAYNILATHVLLPIDIAGSLLIAVFVTFIANKIIDRFY